MPMLFGWEGKGEGGEGGMFQRGILHIVKDVVVVFHEAFSIHRLIYDDEQQQEGVVN